MRAKTLLVLAAVVLFSAPFVQAQDDEKGPIFCAT